ncbi:hypothetical protein ASG86_17705 [Arthrobacter sp. Soil764]|nr:hypothetical protein ASG86_17705 [Arthrobacter sp. Soil764]
MVPALGLMPDGLCSYGQSADAEVAVNIRARALFGAMLAIAPTIQLQPNGHRTRCFEPDVDMLLPVAAKAEN